MTTLNRLISSTKQSQLMWHTSILPHVFIKSSKLILSKQNIFMFLFYLNFKFTHQNWPSVIFSKPISCFSFSLTKFHSFELENLKFFNIFKEFRLDLSILLVTPSTVPFHLIGPRIFDPIFYLTQVTWF